VPRRRLALKSTAAAAFLDLVTRHQLLANAWAPVTLAFDDLAIWANAVLVARLRLDADRDHVTTLGTDLNARILSRFGIQASPAYRPHVTLGYFANVQGAERAQRNLREWSLSAANLVGERELRFRSASVYAFTTLVEFMPVDQPQHGSAV
jgi:2'-5' RNA ligase